MHRIMSFPHKQIFSHSLFTNPMDVFLICFLFQNMAHMEQPDAQEPFDSLPKQAEEEIVVDQSNIETLLASKNFRHRILAYHEISKFPEHISLLQNETVIPALEVVLDTFISYSEPIKASFIINLLPMIAHQKTTIRNKIDLIINKVCESDPEAMEDLLLAQLNNKNNKIIERAVTKLSTRISERGATNRELVMKTAEKISKLFTSTDLMVKKATIQLTVEIYKHIFKKIEKYLEGVKPIIIKDLDMEFSKYEIPKTAIKINEYNFDDSNWKVRLDAMNVLKESAIDGDNFEIIQILQKRLKDVNIQVVIAAVETVKNGNVFNPEIIRLTIMRYKDKKPALSKLITEAVLGSANNVKILMEQLNNKNPDVKIGVLGCLYEFKIQNGNEILEGSIEELERMLDEGNPAVRKAAARVIDGFKNIKEERKNKLEKILDKPVAMFKKAEQKREETSYPSRGSISSDDVRNSQLYGVDWRKRLEFITNNKELLLKEPISVLCELITQKESNFNIIKVVLQIISEHPGLDSYISDVLPLMFLRLTDLKIRDELITILRKIPFDRFLNEWKNNIAFKSGKRFVAVVEIITEYLFGKNSCASDVELSSCTEILRGIQVCGIKERTAVSELNMRIKKVKEQSSDLHFGECGTNAVVPNQSKRALSNTSICNLGDCSFYNSAKVSAAIQDIKSATAHNFDLNMFEINESLICKIFCKDISAEMAISDTNSSLGSTNSKYCITTKSHFIYEPDLFSKIFNRNFVEAVEKDPNLAMHLISILHLTQFAPLLLSLYIFLSLPSPYFNSLILHFISKKHILGEPEASALVQYLLKHNMFDEVAILNRVFPGTKLYVIYRDMVMNGNMVSNCLKEIRRLIEWYNCDLKQANTADLLMRVNQSADLVSLTTEYFKDNELTQQPGSNNDNLVVEDVVNCFKDETDKLVAPSLLVDSNPVNLPDNIPKNLVNIERSLENISISSTPVKKKRNCTANSINSDWLANISNSDRDISIKSLNALKIAVLNSPDSLILHSNTLIGSLTIQLFDKYSDLEIRSMILKILIKVTQNDSFCKSLRYETLWSLNNDLLRIIDNEVEAVDVMINLSTGCNFDILRVYFDVLCGENENIMKLIWTHSKRVNYEERANILELVRILDKFYEEKREALRGASTVMLRVAVAHLKRCCLAYSDGLKGVCGERTNRIIETILAGEDKDTEAIRRCFM